MSDKWCYDLVVDGKAMKLPRVTTILDGAINKPGLLYWSAWKERESILAAVAQMEKDGVVVTGPELAASLPRGRAFIRAKDEAADIGSQAHALIQWHTRRMLKLDVEAEPAVSDAALRGVLAWLEWTKAVDFTPLYTERIVWCARCCVAGTTDVVARIEGRLTVGDYTTGKTIYPEKLLQTNFYRHLLRMAHGIEVEQCVVIRLPKFAEQPSMEAVIAPVIPLAELHAVLTTWRLVRRLNEEPCGELPSGLMCVAA